MKDGELKVFYKNKGEIDSKFEVALRAFLRARGYKFWASGMETESKIRDIAFEKEG